MGQDHTLVTLIEDWLIRNRLETNTRVSNSWINKASNLPYSEFKQICDSLLHVATTLKLMQLERPMNSPLGRAYLRLRVTLQQINSILARKNLTSSWRRRGWPGELR